MTIGIVAAVLGVLLSAAALGIPHLVCVRGDGVALGGALDGEGCRETKRQSEATGDSADHQLRRFKADSDVACCEIA